MPWIRPAIQESAEEKDRSNFVVVRRNPALFFIRMIKEMKY